MKPTWIRVIGWVAFGLWYTLTAHFSYTDISKIAGEDAIALAVMMTLGTGASAAWVLFTIVWKFQQSRARTLAAAMGREPMQAGATGVERKPLWIKVAGGTTTVLLWLSWLFLFSTIKSPPQSDLRDAGSVLMLAGLLGAALWTIASVAWKVSKTSSQSAGRAGALEPGNWVPAPPFAPAPWAPSAPVDKRQDVPQEPVTRPASLAAAEKTTSPVYTYEAPGVPLCPQCDRRPAILFCLCHKLPLCLQCVGAHDRPQECSYRPNWRVVSSEAVQGQTPGWVGRAQKRKTGDVFGIG